MNHLNLWEENIQRRLSRHEVEPPTMGWERLSKQLQATEHTQTANTAHRRPLRVHRIAACITALSAAACLLAVFLLRPAHTQSGNSMAEQTRKALEEVTRDGKNIPSVAATSQTSEASSPIAPAATENAQTRKNVAATSTYQTSADKLLGKAEYNEHTESSLGSPLTEASDTHKKEPSEASATETEKSTAKAVPQQKTIVPPTGHNRVFQTQSALRSTSHKPLLTFSVNSGAGQRTRNSGNYYNPPLLSTSTPESADSNILNDMQELVVSTPSAKVESHIRHRATIRYGLGLSVPLTQRWAIHTGLTYTRLSTDITSGSNEAYYVSEQKLHYVGIPVQVSYTFFNSRFINIYAAAGGAIEKCVKGTLSTTVCNSESKRSNESGSENFAKGLWQASLSISSGLQFNVTKNVGIYAEPGLTYYIPDGSSLPNARHDHPWHFDLQAGLRISLD